jgi:hypothetical protein
MPVIFYGGVRIAHRLYPGVQVGRLATSEPQRDALLAAGIDPSSIYEDMASGHHDARPGLTACRTAPQPGNTLVTTVSHGPMIFRQVFNFDTDAS